MKKIYMQPSIMAMKIQTPVMQSTSLPDTLRGERNVPGYDPNETFEDEEDI